MEFEHLQLEDNRANFSRKETIQNKNHLKDAKNSFLQDVLFSLTQFISLKGECFGFFFFYKQGSVKTPSKPVKL